MTQDIEHTSNQFEHRSVAELYKELPKHIPEWNKTVTLQLQQIQAGILENHPVEFSNEFNQTLLAINSFVRAVILDRNVMLAGRPTGGRDTIHRILTDLALLPLQAESYERSLRVREDAVIREKLTLLVTIHESFSQIIEALGHYMKVDSYKHVELLRQADLIRSEQNEADTPREYPPLVKPEPQWLRYLKRIFGGKK